MTDAMALGPVESGQRVGVFRPVPRSPRSARPQLVHDGQIVLSWCVAVVGEARRGRRPGRSRRPHTHSIAAADELVAGPPRPG